MLFFAPHLLRKRTYAVVVIAAVVGGVIFYNPSLWKGHWTISANLMTWTKIQVALWVTVGAGILRLAAANLARRRDAEALLLLLWIFGTFVFAGFCNWTVNARTILPMAPAVAILILQQMDRSQLALTNGVKISFALSALLALLALEADFSTALAVRETADAVLKKIRHPAGNVMVSGPLGISLLPRCRRGQGDGFLSSKFTARRSPRRSGQ